MNIYVNKSLWHMCLSALVLVSYTPLHAGDTEEGDKKSVAEQSGWVEKLKSNKKTVAAVGAGAVALAAYHFCFLPFFVGAAGGFASEAFVLDNPTVKKFIAEKSSVSGAPLAFMSGIADGAAYYGLSTVGAGLWSGVSGGPMRLGIICGQAAGIAFNNKDYRACVVYGLNKIIGNNRGNSAPSEKVQRELIARSSGAIFSWFCIAGLMGKFPKVF